MLEIIFFIVILIVIAKVVVRKPKNFPDGPTPVPFLGNLFAIDLLKPNSDMLLLNKLYGDVGMVFPFYKIIVLKSPELINEMFNNDNFTGRPDVVLNRDRFQGRNFGLMFTDGRQWKLNKRFTLHHFRNFGMGTRRQETIIHDEIHELLDGIAAIDGQPFKIEDLFYKANINITWAMFGGDRFSHSDPKMAILGDALKAVTHQFNIVGGFVVLFPFLRILFPGWTGYNSYMHYNNLIMDFCKEVIENHKTTRVPNNPRDLIDSYLDEMEIKKAPEDIFNLGQLSGICADALVGGSDTGSATLAFSILFLIIHPEMQEKLADEVHRVVGHDRLPTTDDRNKLVYAAAVFNETLRYRPPAPVILGHRALADSTLGKYDVPKNTIIFPHIEATFFDEEYWPNPEEFNPERFINKEGSLQNVDSVFAFARGKRVCPGEGQARLSNVLLLSSLIQKYRFTFPKDDPIPATEGKKSFLLSCPAYRVIATPREVF